VVNAGVFGCVFIGAGWTIKLQYGILAVLVVAKSRSAAIVMIGYDPPEDESEPLFSPELVECIGSFRNLLLVSSAGGMSITA
jgi:hypothetical protein